MLAGITVEITRFHHILLLGIGHSREIILNPMVEMPYIEFQTIICSQCDDSVEQHLHDLISKIPLGDRKCSSLLLQMRSKALNRMTVDLLKSLFAYPSAADVSYHE
ncbi:retrovirus-related Pol polyprotein from transposon 297 [Nephila pilipes]|uniref:Retrovirus-related Pol polyprotein from transposon 297 n=1 Tax=Nephila pilipes TaxID=299642 RepID=A0A8X6P9Q7_NEPPI|nr:retrovirus-related Pol polyprotein from transposon 297 [Nephila pilipes]GFT49018.1 retrovirus-related Pol polyprotein from transposon 297 [Nephila pilipes]GFT55796.1 retrovirus-related Pol polyprotein from transposon 297 [Nephila pilipes]GFU23429.1 retrovirus-related Pol polyprotein from transposon 297 [Nephila pilipes]